MRHPVLPGFVAFAGNIGSTTKQARLVQEFRGLDSRAFPPIAFVNFGLKVSQLCNCLDEASSTPGWRHPSISRHSVIVPGWATTDGSKDSGNRNSSVWMVVQNDSSANAVQVSEATSDRCASILTICNEFAHWVPRSQSSAHI